MADWPSDKELEEIYRKGSENHDFQYSDDAWKDMETLLDKDRRRKFLIIFFVFIGLAISFGGYYLNNSNSIEQSQADMVEQQAYSNSDTEEIILNNQTSTLTQNNINNLAEGENHSATLRQGENSNNSSESIENSSALPSQNINKTKKTVKRNNVLTKDLSSSNDNLYNGNNSLIKNNSPINANSTQNFSQVPEQVELNSENREAQQIKLIKEVEGKKVNFDYLSDIQTPSIQQFIIAERDRPTAPDKVVLPLNEANKFPRFFIGALATVESSWTPNGEFSSLDGGVGIKINHLLSNKFAISVGGSYINDVYVAEQGDYKASKDFWKVTGAPEYTQANCSMIELSTGFSYYFTGINRQGFSASINLLSNFMLKEEYNYHFTEENNNFSSAWTMANNTWLNGIDFGANYKFDISRNWSIEAGPYIKVPLAGIGHGDVMLSSFGIRVFAGFRTN